MQEIVRQGGARLRASDPGIRAQTMPTAEFGARASGLSDTMKDAPGSADAQTTEILGELKERVSSSRLSASAAMTLSPAIRALKRTEVRLGRPLRVAIVGEFNSGKSSLANLLARDRQPADGCHLEYTHPDASLPGARSRKYGQCISMARRLSLRTNQPLQGSRSFGSRSVCRRHGCVQYKSSICRGLPTRDLTSHSPISPLTTLTQPFGAPWAHRPGRKASGRRVEQVFRRGCVAGGYWWRLIAISCAALSIGKSSEPSSPRGGPELHRYCSGIYYGGPCNDGRRSRRVGGGVFGRKVAPTRWTCCSMSCCRVCASSARKPHSR